MSPHRKSLRWKNHSSNLQTMLSQMLDRGSYCDVTVACKDQSIRCHRVVLSAGSTYFDEMLTLTYKEENHLLVLANYEFKDVKCLLEYIYTGVLDFDPENYDSLMRAAKDLRIKGLNELAWSDFELIIQSNSATPHAPVMLPQGPNMYPKIIPASQSNELNVASGITNPVSNTKILPALLNSPCTPRFISIPEYSPRNHFGPMNIMGQPLQVLNQNPTFERPENNYRKSKLTAQDREEWKDVMKMNSYVITRTRKQFWLEPSTQRVMYAVKSKTLEMEKAMELLGVPYGTLYGQLNSTYNYTSN